MCVGCERVPHLLQNDAVLFILSEHAQYRRIFSQSYRKVTSFISDTDDESDNTATIFFRTVCKFITPLWYQRITAVEMAFTSTEFMPSFRNRLGHVAACSSSITCKL